MCEPTKAAIEFANLPLSLPPLARGIPPLFLSNDARMRSFSLIRPPNHLAAYGGLGGFPKKSG
jgi:hypothetical protein